MILIKWPFRKSLNTSPGTARLLQNKGNDFSVIKQNTDGRSLIKINEIDFGQCEQFVYSAGNIITLLTRHSNPWKKTLIEMQRKRMGKTYHVGMSFQVLTF